VLSALKKSEEGNELIFRCYNISSKTQETKVNFCDFIKIHDAQIVNFLEEEPQNEIKASIKSVEKKSFMLEINPHVIVTIKIKIKD